MISQREKCSRRHGAGRRLRGFRQLVAFFDRIAPSGPGGKLTRMVTTSTTLSTALIAVWPGELSSERQYVRNSPEAASRLSADGEVRAMASTARLA